MKNFDWPYITSGIPDAEFIRGKVPMTKQEVRSISLAKLRLLTDSVIVDIGAGTGSVAIEAARLSTQGQVYAIEREPEALALIKQNQQRFGVNLKLMSGDAVNCLTELEYFDRAFIGGSGGCLSKIISLCDERLPIGGRIVVNAITLETAFHAISIFRELQYSELEAVSINIARGRLLAKSTLMESLNPVTIVCASKGTLV